MTDAQRIAAIYDFKKVDHLPRREFFIWDETMIRWKSEGWDGNFNTLRFDESYTYLLKACEAIGGYDVCKFDKSTGTIDFQHGWTEPPMVPEFEEKIIDSRDGYDYIRTKTSEVIMCPVGKRSGGFMPVFVSAPVESEYDWYNKIKHRLNPLTEERWARFDDIISKYRNSDDLLCAKIIGGYMYLRSLCGPEKLMYIFYDTPELIHDMMQTWLKLMIYSLTKVQDEVPFFKLFLGEDICFKTGSLISPDMINEFLMPYYRDLIQTLKSRQKSHLHVELDSDGNSEEVLPIYIANGFNAWSPCEIAAGCDPVEFGKKFPELIISGGIDKRILAKGKDDIKRELERVIPIMKERGGFIPTCDHGVPDDVSFENYMFYRNYMVSLD